MHVRISKNKHYFLNQRPTKISTHFHKKLMVFSSYQYNENWSWNFHRGKMWHFWENWIFVYGGPRRMNFWMSEWSNQLFFLWEIIQNFFILAWVFISWQLKKIIFMVIWCPNRAWRAVWLILGLKRSILTIFSQKSMFFTFSRFVYTSKQYRSVYKCFKLKFDPPKL